MSPLHNDRTALEQPLRNRTSLLPNTTHSDATLERCIELTIDANFGLAQHPRFKALQEAGWEFVDFDITEDRGREVVVQVIVAR